MTSNHKLTGLLKGRTVTGTQSGSGALRITFSDGSVLTAQTGPGASESMSAGGVVQAVQQSGTMLALVFENGSTLTVSLGEETSSVMVRDAHNVMEYAD